MCNLTLSADMGTETLPDAVAYACRFWIDHVCEIEIAIPLFLVHLDAFLNRHLLHWFEAMSILKKSRDTITLLGNLSTWIAVSFCHTILPSIHQLNTVCDRPIILIRAAFLGLFTMRGDFPRRLLNLLKSIPCLYISAHCLSLLLPRPYVEDFTIMNISPTYPVVFSNPGLHCC
jgi:hypothetical protein